MPKIPVFERLSLEDHDFKATKEHKSTMSCLGATYMFKWKIFVS